MPTRLNKDEPPRRRARPGPLDDMRPEADRALESALRAGMSAYRRERALPALIGADAGLLDETSEGAARTVIARLEKALRAERNRARAGHWTYDLNRHIALRQALRAEAERFAGLRRGLTAASPIPKALS